MSNTSKNSHHNNIDYQKNHELWENSSSTSSKILEILDSSSQTPENFVLETPSKIKPNETPIVSLFLYQILENPSFKDQELVEFSGIRKHFFSEHILYYILTVHSDSHIQEMNSMEKILGIIYSNPEITISNSVKQVQLRVNIVDKPIDVWNNLFPGLLYRYSVLLTVHGSGVMYSNSELSEEIGLYSYASGKI